MLHVSPLLPSKHPRRAHASTAGAKPTPTRRAARACAAGDATRTTASRWCELESRISANDPRDTEEAHFRCCIRRIRERLVAREARKELVLAFGTFINANVGRCRHAARVDGLDLPGVLQDVGELTGEELLFLRRQLEVR